MSAPFRTDLGPFRTVVHPTDFREHSDPALVHAIAIARHARGRLVAVHVNEGDIAPDWELFPHVRSRLALWGDVPPDANPAQLAAKGMHLADMRVPKGEVAEVVRTVVKQENGELLVLAAHARSGWIQLRRHTVAAPTVHRSGIPALIHRDGTTSFVEPITGKVTLHRVLVPVDDDPSPNLSLSALFRLFDSLGVLTSAVRLFHVGPLGSMPAVWPEPARKGIRIEDAYGDGLPSAAIADYAARWDADLIVMSTTGRRGLLDALSGSTVEKVVAAAPCPVLAVPQPRP
ncbi:MAG: nucleotide-binding universal stress UspA family protein [Myxococcota bacterium]|jgi:nucleotide-binding universal stress UspA family protein